MICVSLFGQPSAGKSTGAAYIYATLKLMGVNVELVTEFAKDCVWEENSIALENQLYITGVQSYRLSRLKDKVDVVVTDSPLLLGLQYNKTLSYHYAELIKEVFYSYDNLSFFINRVKPYNPSGRYQTEEESDVIADEIKQILIENSIPFYEVDGDVDGYTRIVNIIKNYIELNLEKK